MSPSGTITTVAGAFAPRGLAVDAIGNVFIADTENCAIRELSISGALTLIAGLGDDTGCGYSGDGGPATSAALLEPAGIAVDAHRNVYIADAGNCRVRVVPASGTISTFAGTGKCGFSGDGEAATSAELNDPEGVAVDASGNVLIADRRNGRVREVLMSGVIDTVAGNGDYGSSGDGGPATAASLEYPYGVTLDNVGGFFIVDSLRIRDVNGSGTIATIAGNGFTNYGGDDGPAVNAQLALPGSVAVDASGNVLIADTENLLVREVIAPGAITTVAGNGIVGILGDGGPATAAEFRAMSGVAFDASGAFYVADAVNNVVRKVSSAGVVTTFAGNGTAGYSGDGGPANAASLNNPSGLAADAAGNVFIADTLNNVIRKVDAFGTITTVAGNGTAGFLGGELSGPVGVAVDSSGSIFIADTQNDRIQEVSAATGITATVAGNGSSGYYGDGGPATSAALDSPRGIAIDGNGNLFIADLTNDVIRRVNSAGIITTVAGSGKYGYSGDGGPARSAMFDDPETIAIGPNGVIYVADSLNNAVRALTPCSVIVSTTLSADSRAQTITTPVTSDSSCAWGVTSLPPWISTTSTGSGAGALSLTLEANTTGAARSAPVLVNNVWISVKQDFTAAVFNDVPPAAYYFDAVNLLAAKSVTVGCGTGEYCASQSVTRDEMAVFLVKMVYGSNAFTYSPTPYFSDVPATNWAFPFIQKLYELNITSGCSPELYCPDAAVTRAEAAVGIIKARYGAGTPFTWSADPYFADVIVDGFASAFIQRMYQDGITSGCSPVPLDYCPNNSVIRGDMAVFLMKGGFNQLLPPTMPVITSVQPATLARGTTGTFTVVGTSTTFQQGLTALVFSPASGITVNSISVTSPTTMTVSLTASPAAPVQPQSIYEQTGPQEAVLPNSLLIQ